MSNGKNATLAPDAAAESPSAAGLVNRIDLRYLGGVVGAGTIGGLLYWVIARFSGTAIPGNFGPAGAIFALMFVGAIAATIGVYLLTASDPTAIRTYIFAVLCGLMWQPVIASGERLAQNAIATNQDSAVTQSLQGMQSAASSGNVDQINSAVNQTVPAVTKALSATPNVTDTDKKTEIAEASKSAITLLQSSAAKAPESSVEGLKNIALTAANSNQPAVGVSAVQALRTVAEDAARAHNGPVLLKVQQTLLSLAESAKDPTVQKSARDSAAELNSAH